MTTNINIFIQFKFSVISCIFNSLKVFESVFETYPNILMIVGNTFFETVDRCNFWTMSSYPDMGYLLWYKFHVNGVWDSVIRSSFSSAHTIVLLMVHKATSLENDLEYIYATTLTLMQEIHINQMKNELQRNTFIHMRRLTLAVIVNWQTNASVVSSILICCSIIVILYQI